MLRSWGSGERLHRVDERERLEPEFAEEPVELLPVFRERLLAVPDPPVMHVSRPVRAGVADLRRVRRARPIAAAGVEPLHRPGQDLVEDLLVIVPDRRRVLLFPAPMEPALLALVVPAPERDRGPVPQLLDNVLGLGPDVLPESGVAGHQGTGEHEVLPDEESQLVAEVIEIGGFVDPALPKRAACSYWRRRSREGAIRISAGRRGAGRNRRESSCRPWRRRGRR